ncbi:MAG TPA: phosphoglucomutase/phosphomannomutase family protein [Candidatus Kapabacteria bacterium]|nr:phosphoglucomutase/phosphomannomutase family protein [Candidatus Kapabacteria bacterium]
MIKFGTDGWRGIIARDFTFDNIRLVALATAKYLIKLYPNKSNIVVVVGYDTRFLSRQFAEETSLVLASEGINVELTESISSTPQVSYQTKAKGADLGIIITASHNPAQYNGYKVKASYGGPAKPEDIAALETELKVIWDNPPIFKLKSLDEYIKLNKIKQFDSKTTFVEYIKGKIDIDAIIASGVKVLYDPMHGAGINTIKRLLPNADEIHGDYNPSFGDIDHPEPIDEILTTLKSKVVEGKYDVGFATDGDADRIGLVDSYGNFVDSHKIFMILLKYLYEIKGERGSVAKTVSLTSMVNQYCEKHNIQLFETAVGFKYIAKLMVEEKILIGGEESGGLGTIVHIPERDGLFNGLMVLEVMAKRKMSLNELCIELDNEFGVHRYSRRDIYVSEAQKNEILNAAKNTPKELGRFDVLSSDTTDGYKFFVNNGWLLIRASGTEPLIRFYAESNSIESVNELLDAGMKLK